MLELFCEEVMKNDGYSDTSEFQTFIIILFCSLLFLFHPLLISLLPDSFEFTSPSTAASPCVCPNWTLPAVSGCACHRLAPLHTVISPQGSWLAIVWRWLQTGGGRLHVWSENGHTDLYCFPAHKNIEMDTMMNFACAVSQSRV